MSAREKAIKIEESAVINVFQTSKFKEKTPFPSLETMGIYVRDRAKLRSAHFEQLDVRIFNIINRNRDIRVSPEFH